WANSPATGNQTATVTIAAALSKNGYQYECVIKDKYGNTVTTTAATLTVQTPLKITAQPANATAAPGANATFTVKVTGDGLTYQWKYRTSSTGTWANSPATGNQTATVTIAAAASKNGYQYECVIKDKYGKSVTSSAATLTVQTPLKITAQPQNKTVTTGTEAKFTVKVTGEGLKYQWQYRKNADGTWTNTTVTGCNTATLTLPGTASRNGYRYRCVITDKYGKKVTSNTVTLTVQ
ncbi:MAG: immunoglobulin domain-containing protein, partial [Clostridia bacterium]|nr:immunoglobulin domain-containing protein [Clostridia bacterium]